MARSLSRYISQVFLGLAVFYFQSCQLCQQGGQEAKIAIGSVSFNKNGPHVRCYDNNKWDAQPYCRHGSLTTDEADIAAICIYGGTIFPNDIQFNTYGDCVLYTGYKMCYEQFTGNYRCRKDIEGCPTPYFNPVNVDHFGSKADCEAAMPNWYRCAGSDGPVCRQHACNGGEAMLLGTEMDVFETENHCKENLYAGRPCYVAQSFIGDAPSVLDYYHIVTAWDENGGACPPGAVLLTATYTHAPSRIEVNDTVVESYMLHPEMLLNHYRCKYAQGLPVCRPNMGTDVVPECAYAETRLNATYPNVFDNLAECNDNRYVALLCHSNNRTATIADGNKFLCILDTVYNACPPEYELMQSYNFPATTGSNTNPWDDAMAACNEVATDPEVLWVRCSKSAGAVCRPKGSGCAGDEVLLQPAAGMNLTACLQFDEYIKCYVYNTYEQPSYGEPYFTCVPRSAGCGSLPADHRQIGPAWADHAMCYAYNPANWVRCGKSDLPGITNVGRVTCRPAVDQAGCLEYWEYNIDPPNAIMYPTVEACLAGGYERCYNTGTFTNPIPGIEDGPYACRDRSIIGSSCPSSYINATDGIIWDTMDHCKNAAFGPYVYCLNTAAGQPEYVTCRPAEVGCTTTESILLDDSDEPKIFDDIDACLTKDGTALPYAYCDGVSDNCRDCSSPSSLNCCNSNEIHIPNPATFSVNNAQCTP